MKGARKSNELFYTKTDKKLLKEDFFYLLLYKRMKKRIYLADSLSPEQIEGGII